MSDNIVVACDHGNISPAGALHQEKTKGPLLGCRDYVTQVGPLESGGIHNVTEGR